MPLTQEEKQAFWKVHIPHIDPAKVKEISFLGFGFLFLFLFFCLHKLSLLPASYNIKYAPQEIWDGKKKKYLCNF